MPLDELNSSVYPSGLDFATMFMPIVPVAPARLSITVVIPRFSPSACPKTRARVSLRPPAANGTTRRTGLDGYGATAPFAALAAARARTSAQLERGGFIGLEPRF